ncbi:MAG: Smr/MutS family protein [Kordiimonadaceae bacterium]|nr:Smr/MutS family protein [Kordiimonadaceae bacterium]
MKKKSHQKAPSGAGKPALSASDEKLWGAVTKDVEKLGDRPAGAVIPPRRMVTRLDSERPLSSDWFTSTAPEPTPKIDRKTKRKLSKGAQEVDQSIDLHGRTQTQAYSVLKSSVEAAIRRGDKTLLVVTGKGGARFSQIEAETPVAYRTRDDFDQYGGVLKRMVPEWLNGQELKPFIQSYGPASKEPGGDGALYVLLRKRIPGSRNTGNRK